MLFHMVRVKKLKVMNRLIKYILLVFVSFNVIQRLKAQKVAVPISSYGTWDLGGVADVISILKQICVGNRSFK